MRLKKSKMENKKAIIIATKEQLEEIGCDKDLIDLELEITDIDKQWGMYGNNSTVIFNHKIGELNFKEEYMIPTKWLKFK